MTPLKQQTSLIPQQHIYNGLACPADYSIFVR